MKRFSLPAVMLALGLHSGTVTAMPLVLQGDIITGALPIAALSVAYLKSDGEGGKQWLRNTSVNAAVNSIFRIGFEQTSLGPATRWRGRLRFSVRACRLRLCAGRIPAGSLRLEVRRARLSCRYLRRLYPRRDRQPSRTGCHRRCSAVLRVDQIIRDAKKRDAPCAHCRPRLARDSLGALLLEQGVTGVRRSRPNLFAT